MSWSYFLEQCSWLEQCRWLSFFGTIFETMQLTEKFNFLKKNSKRKNTSVVVYSSSFSGESQEKVTRELSKNQSVVFYYAEKNVSANCFAINCFCFNYHIFSEHSFCKAKQLQCITLRSYQHHCPVFQRMAWKIVEKISSRSIKKIKDRFKKIKLYLILKKL